MIQRSGKKHITEIPKPSPIANSSLESIADSGSLTDRDQKTKIADHTADATQGRRLSLTESVRSRRYCHVPKRDPNEIAMKIKFEAGRRR